jgi:hypothetical protein
MVLWLLVLGWMHDRVRQLELLHQIYKAYVAGRQAARVAGDFQAVVTFSGPVIAVMLLLFCLDMQSLHGGGRQVEPWLDAMETTHLCRHRSSSC